MTERNFWKKEEEVMLKGWADKALCYYWMHLQAHRKYRLRNALYTVPVIIISTITGTANFAQSNYGAYVQLATILIGSMNIIAGIITTIFQFLKISELNEGHRAASLSWCKFNEYIRIELQKNPLDRKPPKDLLSYCADQYTHLLEFSPLLTEDIIIKFKQESKKFENYIIIPEIVGRLRGTSVFDEVALANLLVSSPLLNRVSSEEVSSDEEENGMIEKSVKESDV
jgi:hypothetical protein